LEKCIKIRPDDILTKHLDIDYGKLPRQPNCPRDPWCPCSAAYTNHYYGVGGPTGRCVKNIVKKYSCPACARKRRPRLHGKKALKNRNRKRRPRQRVKKVPKKRSR